MELWRAAAECNNLRLPDVRRAAALGHHRGLQRHAVNEPSRGLACCALLPTSLLHCILYSSSCRSNRHCHTFEYCCAQSVARLDLSLLNHGVLFSFEIAHNVFSTFAFLTFLVRRAFTLYSHVRFAFTFCIQHSRALTFTSPIRVVECFSRASPSHFLSKVKVVAFY